MKIVKSEAWHIEPATRGDQDGRATVWLIHGSNAPMLVKRDELPSLLGALLRYLDDHEIPLWPRSD